MTSHKEATHHEALLKDEVVAAHVDPSDVGGGTANNS